MDKKNLVIVKNSNNDNGSQLYLNQIRKQWKENYQDSINLITYTIDDQEVLLDVMFDHPNAKFLLLTPTNLVFPEHMQSRNAEQNQTANYVVDVIKQLYTQENTPILVLGGIDGNVSSEIATQLMKEKYGVMLSGSRLNMACELTQNFEVVINCIPQDKQIEIHLCCNMLFDVSGNLIKKDKPILINYAGDNGYIPSVVENEYGIREIGKMTVWRLLEEVKNGGK